MKERPILFSAPMVRALLAGTKTQTRRIFKPERMTWDANGRYTTYAMRGGELSITGSGPFKPSSWLHYCPYGQPGDRLWVRETHGYGGDAYVPDIHFRATDPDAPVLGRWHPSIHMRRIDSRITLEITEVRVERLQDITIEDAKAEGAWGPDDSIVDKVAKHFGIDVFSANPCKAFQMLWEQINGQGSWAENPWVWVVDFKGLP